MKKLLALLFVLVSMITLASCGGKETLVVYTEAGFAPFEYVSGGEITGVDVEIMNLTQWLCVLGLSVSIIPIVEIQKAIYRVTHKK